MSLPTLNGVGRLTADPELRFAPSGTAVCTLNLAFNARRKDENGQWQDGDVLFLRATAFHHMAESIAENLTRGTEVTATGRVKLDQWQDKNTGEKRSRPNLVLDAIGPNLKTTHQPATPDTPEPAGWSGSPEQAPF